MESASRSAILNFIKDFRLKSPESIVEFAATVRYQSDQTAKSFTTDVQIITSGSIEAVYLMNQEMSASGLPDSFVSSREKFIYIPSVQLEIEHSENSEQYSVIIVPLTRSKL